MHRSRGTRGTWNPVRRSWQWLKRSTVSAVVDRTCRAHTELFGPTSERFTPPEHGNKFACCDGFDWYHPPPSSTRDNPGVLAGSIDVDGQEEAVVGKDCSGQSSRSNLSRSHHITFPSFSSTLTPARNASRSLVMKRAVGGLAFTGIKGGLRRVVRQPAVSITSKNKPRPRAMVAGKSNVDSSVAAFRGPREPFTGNPLGSEPCLRAR